MREIKFRGKRVDKGEWVYGSLLISEHQEKNLEPLHYFICPLDKGYHRVIPETVGQYTGLADKNGKKIFEGDIVRTKHGDVKKIIYKDYWGAFGVQYGLLFDKESGKHVKAHGGLSHFYGDSQFYEVIGNIHDNPELLEGSK